MIENGQAHLGTHPLTETTCDYQWCWCHQKARDHQYGPHSSGNLISDGKNARPYDGFNAAPYDATRGTANAAPLLYTQAQVDVLVAAETQRCSSMIRELAGEGDSAIRLLLRGIAARMEAGK